MQSAFPRQVERLQYFFSPVGIHVSNLSSGKRKRRVTACTSPFSAVSGKRSHATSAATDFSATALPVSTATNSTATVPLRAVTDSSSSALSWSVPSMVSAAASMVSSAMSSTSPPASTTSATDDKLSLRHRRNRRMYYSLGVDAMDEILERLLSYGFDSSSEIAQMQPWQLRVLKREINCIEQIYMRAFQMWGRQETYDETYNKMYRQFSEAAVWLELNEVQLIMKSFDSRLYAYRCFICGAEDTLHELDALRMHLWTQHRNCLQLQYAMEESKSTYWVHRLAKSSVDMEAMESAAAFHSASLAAASSMAARPRRSVSVGKRHATAKEAMPEVIDLVEDSSDDSVVEETPEVTRHSSPTKTRVRTGVSSAGPSSSSSSRRRRKTSSPLRKSKSKMKGTPLMAVKEKSEKIATVDEDCDEMILRTASISSDKKTPDTTTADSCSSLLGSMALFGELAEESPPRRHSFCTTMADPFASAAMEIDSWEQSQQTMGGMWSLSEGMEASTSDPFSVFGADTGARSLLESSTSNPFTFTPQSSMNDGNLFGTSAF